MVNGYGWGWGSSYQLGYAAALKWRTAVRVRTVERTNPDRPVLEHPSNIKPVLYNLSIQ